MDYQVQEDYVPIIGYHRIGGPPSSHRTTIKRFNNQVEYLTKVVGCNWITMERLSEYIEKRVKIPTKTCVMTFDDSIRTQYHNALCALNKFKVPATYYVITSFIGKKSYYMTWDEVKKLDEIGHDIETHTKTHARLHKLNITEQEEEILGCKKNLEDRGYTVKTFAYPYGAYNEDTLEILRHSDYILTRDTRQDRKWKNPRAITIRQNPDYLLHFFYIRPELEDGPELWERMKYTGWWQFEDNYKIVRGYKGSVKILSNSKLLSTKTSYANLLISRYGDEISTQFITKYEGGFTLYIVAYNRTASPAFTVKVDGVQYNVHASNDVYQTHHYRFYGFYVNIKSLSSGVHLLNIRNRSYKRLYLDKFSLHSNVNQEFKDRMYYKDCDPESDDYCQCD